MEVFTSLAGEERLSTIVRTVEGYRDHLAANGWRGDGPPPDLPSEVIDGTVSRYREIYHRLTGREWVSA